MMDALIGSTVGSIVVFGLNGAFLGSAFGYPLGAPRHWTLADDQLHRTGDVAIRIARLEIEPR